MGSQSCSQSGRQSVNSEACTWERSQQSFRATRSSSRIATIGYEREASLNRMRHSSSHSSPEDLQDFVLTRTTRRHTHTTISPSGSGGASDAHTFGNKSKPTSDSSSSDSKGGIRGRSARDAAAISSPRTHGSSGSVSSMGEHGSFGHNMSAGGSSHNMSINTVNEAALFKPDESPQSDVR